MKMLSPQITGTEAAMPGTSAPHFTPSFVLNLEGSPVSLEDPSWFGPRQLGQFSAPAKEVSKTRARRVAVVFMSGNAEKSERAMKSNCFRILD
jgi:hypothetical protein